MGRIAKISVALPEEMLQSVKDAVDSGQYASTSEVIHDALRGWRLRESLRKAEIERLRKAWEEGLASGPAKEYDIEEILSGPRQRLEEIQRKRA